MILLYLLLLCGLFLFYLLYSDDLSFIILLSAAFTPVLMFIQLVYTRSRIKFSAAAVSNNIRKGENSSVEITVENPTIFPMSLAKLNIRCTSFPSGVNEIRRVTVPLPAKSTHTLSITVYSPYCQKIECTVTKITLYDMLHLLSLEKKQTFFNSVSVDFIPEGGFPIDAETAGRLEMPSVSSDTIPKKRNVQIPEYDELREYREGDKMNRIAWKLSGRTGSDELIVRDSGNLSSAAVLIAADTASAKDEKTADRIFECFYRAAHILIEHDKCFDSISADGKMILNVSSENEADECIIRSYGKPISAESAADAAQKRRYDEVYIVTAESPDSGTAEKIRNSCTVPITFIYCNSSGQSDD